MMLRVDQRRLKRSEIRTPGVIGALEGPPRCVDAKNSKQQGGR
jgi:hypothetical protein